MLNQKFILKILFALGIWSFVLLGLYKIHDYQVVEFERLPNIAKNGRLLLQKDNKYGEATSTTTDQQILPADVLIDNRQGELVFYYFINFIV